MSDFFEGSGDYWSTFGDNVYSDWDFANNGDFWELYGDDGTGFTYDAADAANDVPLDMDNFWDSTPGAWDQAYAEILAPEYSEFTMPDDIAEFAPEDYLGISGEGESEKSWLDKSLDFLGSKDGMVLMKGILGSGMSMYNQQRASDAEGRRDAEDRAFQERMLRLKQAHDERMLALRQGGGGGGPARPSPGRADKTTTSIGDHKVKWS